MVSLTKMAGLGELLTRGCCSLKDKNSLGPRCMEGEVMENEHGSVRERNCMEENCNSGSLEEKAIIERQAQLQQPQVIRKSRFLFVFLHRL